MKRFAVACLVGLFASAAAQASRLTFIGDFDPVGVGVTENPNVNGFAIVFFDDSNPDATTTSVLVVASRLNPGAWYGVLVEGSNGSFWNSAAFKAGPFFGAGSFSVTIDGDSIGENPVVTIYKELGNPLDFPDADTEYRAQGN